MTSPTRPRDTDALEAIQRLEARVAAEHDKRQATETRLAQAKDEAERLLAAARSNGTEAGAQRRAEILADGAADAESIRAHAETSVQRLRERVLGERERLVTELIEQLLPEGR